MAAKSPILKKDQTISRSIEVRKTILTEAEKLSEAQRDVVFLGIWSMKDLLAHMIGWDHTNLAAAQSVLQGQVPAFYQYKDRDWRTYNAMLVKQYRHDSFPELVAALKKSQEKLLQFLQTIPPEDFHRDFGARFRGYKITIQRLIVANTEDEQTHYEQMTSFFRGSE